MTVRELIELLSTLDPDREIRAESAGWDSEAPGTPEIRTVAYSLEEFLVIGSES